MQNNKRTELSALGEFGLIDTLAADFGPTLDTTVKGIGDDAAAIAGTHPVTLVSTDMLLEGIHFDLAYTPLKHLGYKAVAVNLSDIAAMNAVPSHITVSIALSNRFSVEAVQELYEGIKLACDEYNVDLAGGDTTSSMAGLVISITAIGYAEKENIVYRSGAAVGEVICVTGDLGAAYMGLQILMREKQEYLANPDMQPDLHEHDYLIQRQLKPEARVDIVHELKELGVKPTAMIDVSDGLGSELLHIAKQSNIGIAIFQDQLPVDEQTKIAASEFGLSLGTVALSGGEDYELLFTLTQADYEKIRHLGDVTAIGITRERSEGVSLVTGGGQAVPVTAQGWNHFE